MTKKIICITGATGFIGKNLLNNIDKSKFKIRVVTRKKFVKFDEEIEVMYGDLSDINFPFTEFLKDVDCLINCMGQIKDNADLFKNNVNSVSLLITNLEKKIAKNNNIFHWVQISSSGVYGANTMSYLNKFYVHEDSLCKPKTIYEKSKHQADLIIIKTSKKIKTFKYTILRPTAVCDNEMPNRSLINLISLIKKNIFFYIGKPQSIANYIHRDDFTDSILLTISNAKSYNKTYIVSADCYWEDIVNQIIVNLKIKKNILRVPYWVGCIYIFFYRQILHKHATLPNLENLMSRTRYSNSKINEELGFKVKRNIPEFIQEFVNNLDNSK